MASPDLTKPPPGWGVIGGRTELSGVFEESVLRKYMTDLDGDEDARYDSLSHLQAACVNKTMASDILCIDGFVDALKRARDAEDDPVKDAKRGGHSTPWGWANCLVQILEAKDTRAALGSMHFDPFAIKGQPVEAGA